MESFLSLRSIMRKILVTGATSGFGKLTVEAFLKEGDTVIATGRNLTKRTEIFADARRDFSTRLIEVDLDVTDASAIENAAQLVSQELGDIDILINNAGFGLFGALEDLKEDEIRYQMEVNFFGTMNVTKTFLPMLRSSKGKIFNFSSVFGFMGWPLTGLYCASKFAVEGLTESLRGELAPHGVQVCLIEPGGYRTNFGSSLAWTETTEASPYFMQFKNYQKLRERMAQRKPQLPSEVSEGLVRLSKKSKLPMRKVFGKDGTASHYLKRLLPSVIYFLVIDAVIRKVFSSKN